MTQGPQKGTAFRYPSRGVGRAVACRVQKPRGPTRTARTSAAGRRGRRCPLVAAAAPRAGRRGRGGRASAAPRCFLEKSGPEEVSLSLSLRPPLPVRWAADLSLPVSSPHVLHFLQAAGEGVAPAGTAGVWGFLYRHATHLYDKFYSMNIFL